MTTIQHHRIGTAEDALTAVTDDSVHVWWDGEGECGCCVDCPDFHPSIVVNGWECHGCGVEHIVIGDPRTARRSGAFQRP